ncbi:MAG TPA: hypothetical protein VHZ54_02535 [Solirubrobacterales bacterium]|nr:hypothetical protein [Solirubrobacterales bacterium]
MPASGRGKPRTAVAIAAAIPLPRPAVEELTREAIRLSFDTKVTGPLMLAKALRGQIAGSGRPRTWPTPRSAS